MNSLDSLKLTGKLKIVVTGEDGSIKDTREVDNLVVSAGIGFIASRMKDATATAMSHMAIGTGALPAAAGNTNLGTEVARVTLTSTTANATNVVYVASFPANTPASAQGITEAGILNAGSGGTLLCRTVFSVINKGTADSMTVTWTINLTAV